MRTFTKEELSRILENHKKWLEDESGGERADLKYADLRYADLSHADLKYADLRYADLSHADLKYADLRYAYLRRADLSHADLSHADLKYADLRYAYLRRADLSHADLSHADLRHADLRHADLKYAYLRETIVIGMRGQKVIAVQLDTSRRNNLIQYWVDLDVITTGCFQGTLEELKEKVQETHKDNEFLRKRYERAIAFIENEIAEEKNREELENDRKQN